DTYTHRTAWDFSKAFRIYSLALMAATRDFTSATTELSALTSSAFTAASLAAFFTRPRPKPAATAAPRITRSRTIFGLLLLQTRTAESSQRCFKGSTRLYSQG